MLRNRSTILNVKAIHYPSICKPLSEIEQNLFQELGSAVFSSDGLYHADWFVGVQFPWVETAVQRPGDMALRMR